MNKVFINGNLTKDMDVKVLQNGNYVGKFTIANTVGYGDKKKTYFEYLNLKVSIPAVGGEDIKNSPMTRLCKAYEDFYHKYQQV